MDDGIDVFEVQRRLDDLPCVKVTVVNGWLDDTVAVVAVQDLGRPYRPHSVSHVVEIPAYAVRTMAAAKLAARYAAHQIADRLRPWSHPDRPVFPVIDLFPGWVRRTRWLRPGR